MEGKRQRTRRGGGVRSRACWMGLSVMMIARVVVREGVWKRVSMV